MTASGSEDDGFEGSAVVVIDTRRHHSTGSKRAQKSMRAPACSGASMHVMPPMWCIGIILRPTSSGDSARLSARARAAASSDGSVCRTRRGSPVVPDVCSSSTMSSGALYSGSHAVAAATVGCGRKKPPRGIRGAGSRMISGSEAAAAAACAASDRPGTETRHRTRLLASRAAIAAAGSCGSSGTAQ